MISTRYILVHIHTYTHTLSLSHTDTLSSKAFQKTKPARDWFPEATAISHIKEKWNDQPQLNCNLLLQIHRNQETKWTAPKDFDIISIFWQCNRKLKTASKPTKPCKPSLKTAIEMNEIKYQPIDSCINTLSSSTWPHNNLKQWKIERP